MRRTPFALLPLATCLLFGGEVLAAAGTDTPSVPQCDGTKKPDDVKKPPSVTSRPSVDGHRQR